MIDRRLESDIKALKVFLELWSGFHSLYNDTTSKDVITKEDEERFLQTKATISGKYEELQKALEFRYMPRGRLTDPVCDILSIGNIHFMSEKSSKKIEADWKDSYILLNSILERFKERKRRMKQFNPVGVFFKRVLNR